MFLTSFFDPGRPPGRSSGGAQEPSQTSSSSSSPSFSEESSSRDRKEQASFISLRGTATTNTTATSVSGRNSSAPWLDLQSQLRRQLQQSSPSTSSPPPALPPLSFSNSSPSATSSTRRTSPIPGQDSSLQASQASPSSSALPTFLEASHTKLGTAPPWGEGVNKQNRSEEETSQSGKRLLPTDPPEALDELGSGGSVSSAPRGRRRDDMRKDGDRRRSEEEREEEWNSSMRARTSLAVSSNEKESQRDRRHSSSNTTSSLSPLHATNTTSDSLQDHHVLTTHQVYVHPVPLSPRSLQGSDQARKDFEAFPQSPSGLNLEKNNDEIYRPSYQEELPSGNSYSSTSQRISQKLHDRYHINQENTLVPHTGGDGVAPSNDCRSSPSLLQVQQHDASGVHTPPYHGQEQRENDNAKSESSSFFYQHDRDDKGREGEEGEHNEGKEIGEEEEKKKETREVLVKLPAFANTTERLIQARNFLEVQLASRPSHEDLLALNILPNPARWNRDKDGFLDRVEKLLGIHLKAQETSQQLHDLLLSSTCTLDKDEESSFLLCREKEERKIPIAEELNTRKGGEAVLSQRQESFSVDSRDRIIDHDSEVLFQKLREERKRENKISSSPQFISSSSSPLVTCDSLLYKALGILRGELHEISPQAHRAIRPSLPHPSSSSSPSSSLDALHSSSFFFKTKEKRGKEQEDGRADEEGKHSFCSIYQRVLLSETDEEDPMTDLLYQASDCLNEWILREQTKLGKLQRCEEEEDEEKKKREEGEGKEEEEKERKKTLLEEARDYLHRMDLLKADLEVFQKDLSLCSDVKKEKNKEKQRTEGISTSSHAGEEEEEKKEDYAVEDGDGGEGLALKLYGEMENVLLLEKKEQFLRRLIHLLQATETARILLSSLVILPSSSSSLPPGGSSSLSISSPGDSNLSPSGSNTTSLSLSGGETLPRLNSFLCLLEYIADEVCLHEDLPTYTCLHTVERLLCLVAHALPLFYQEISSRLRLLAWGRAVKRDEKDFFSKSEEDPNQEKKNGNEERRELDKTESSRDQEDEEEAKEQEEEKKKKSVSFSSSSWSLFRKKKNDQEEEESEKKKKKESLTEPGKTGEHEDIQLSLHHGDAREDGDRQTGDLFLYLAGLFLLQQIWSYFSELDKAIHQDLERKKKMKKNREETSVNTAGRDLLKLSKDKNDVFERKEDREESMVDSSHHRERHWRWDRVVGDQKGATKFSSLPSCERIWSVQTLAESLVTAFNFHFCREGGSALSRLDRPDWARDFLLQQLERHEELIYRDSSLLHHPKKGLGWIDPRDEENFSFLSAEIERYTSLQNSFQKKLLSLCDHPSFSRGSSSVPSRDLHRTKQRVKEEKEEERSKDRVSKEVPREDQEEEEERRRRLGESEVEKKGEETEGEDSSSILCLYDEMNMDLKGLSKIERSLPPLVFYRSARDLSLCIDPVEGLQIILASVFRQFLLRRMPLLIYTPIVAEASSSSSGTPSSSSFFDKALEQISLKRETEKNEDSPSFLSGQSHRQSAQRSFTSSGQEEGLENGEKSGENALLSHSDGLTNTIHPLTGRQEEQEEEERERNKEKVGITYEIASTYSGTAALFLKHLEQALFLHDEWRDQNSLKAACEVMKDFSNNTLIWPLGDERGERAKEEEIHTDRAVAERKKKKERERRRRSHMKKEESRREESDYKDSLDHGRRRYKEKDARDSCTREDQEDDRFQERTIRRRDEAMKRQGGTTRKEKDEEERRRATEVGRGLSLLRGFVTAALLEDEEGKEEERRTKEERNENPFDAASETDANLSETSGWGDDSFNSWMEEEDNERKDTKEEKEEEGKELNACKRTSSPGHLRERDRNDKINSHVYTSQRESDEEEDDEEEEDEEEEDDEGTSPNESRPGPVGMLDFWISLDKAFMMRELEGLVEDQAVEKHRDLATLLQHTPGRMQACLENSNELVASSLALFEAALPRAGALGNDDALERFYEGVFGPALERLTETIKGSWNGLDCLAANPSRCALLLESVTALCMYLDPLVEEETPDKKTQGEMHAEHRGEGENALLLTRDTNSLLLRAFFRRFLPSHVDALVSMRNRMEEFIFLEVQEDIQASLPRLAKVSTPLDRALNLLLSLTSPLHLELQRRLQSRCLLEIDRSLLSQVKALSRSLAKYRPPSSPSSEVSQQLYTLEENCLHTYAEARRLFPSLFSPPGDDFSDLPSLHSLPDLSLSSSSSLSRPRDPMPRTHAAGLMFLRARENPPFPSSSSSVNLALGEAISSLERELEIEKSLLSSRSHTGSSSGFNFLHSLSHLATGGLLEGEKKMKPKEENRLSRKEGSAEEEEDEAAETRRRRGGKESHVERDDSAAMRFWGRVQNTAGTYLGYGGESGSKTFCQETSADEEKNRFLRDEREREESMERKKRTIHAMETLANLLGVTDQHYCCLSAEDLLSLGTVLLHLPPHQEASTSVSP
ncbi:hypothetical protein CSUI_001902 [Cystoisospora suis]|uniref:Uncharacterized protein n=1 Tax=Cystoisospora suis TaxID=483139 RepID=A0A2C6LB12_9APIC|nr:hypothetical protein CSUI_001902 [Cystoisospora suis]